MFVVLHIGAHKSELPWLLNQTGPLPGCHPKDGDPIQAGHIYVAPPDHHLVVEPGHMRLTRGRRENWARPAVDPLFRSAARAYGPSAIGVILTGARQATLDRAFAEHPERFVKQSPRPPQKPTAAWINPLQHQAIPASLN